MSANNESDKKSVAARLVAMAQERYLLGVSEDGEPFGADRVRPHLAILLRAGKAGLHAELASRYFAETGTVAGGQALTDATLVLEGLAANQPPERLYLRVGELHGTSYIDTGRTDGKVIRLRAGTWSVIDTAPVRFLRTKLTAAMPLPPQNGDLYRLWDFINVAAADRPVLLAALTATLVQNDVPHPVLALFAEQGSAKTTTTRMLIDLTDPSPVPVRQAPRDADSWVTAASGSWVVALDNLSAIPPWLSDSLCRAATGDGNVKRALYTDADLAVVKFRRCIIINGIDVGAVGPDLAERMAMIDLRRIDRHARKAEATMREQWDEARPSILSGLLDLAARVHHRLETIQLDDAPRMADFGRVLACVDEILLSDGLRRYMSRADQLSEDSLSADPFVERLRHHTREPLRGRSGVDLPALITPTGGDWRRPKEWPRNGRDVTSLLRRHAPALRKLGWAIEDDGARNHRNVLQWTIYPPHTKTWLHTRPRSPRLPRCYAPAPQQCPRPSTQRPRLLTSTATTFPHNGTLFSQIRLVVAWRQYQDSLEGAAVMSLHDDLENLATAAVSDWPEISLSGQLDVAIRDLYRTHLPFPQFRTPEEREEYVEEWASFDYQRLVTQFDDAGDVVIDRFGRQNGYLPHADDAAEMIAEARKEAVYELDASIAYLAEDLAQKAIHTAGRTVPSMTGCSTAARRARRKSRRRPRRIR